MCVQWNFLLSKFVWFVSYATYKLSPGWEGKKEARGRCEKSSLNSQGSLAGGEATGAAGHQLPEGWSVGQAEQAGSNTPASW